MWHRRYTLDQLAWETGVSKRRIRRWVQKGLLPPTTRAGRYGSYTQEHVERIREIQDILDHNMRLADLYDHFHPIAHHDDTP